MDFKSLATNVKVAWGQRASASDAVRRVIWLYADRLPSLLAPRESVIAFRYAAPIENVRFLLRNNGGADAYVHSEVFEHEYYRLPLPSPPATILDLGANIGLSAVYFARTFPNATLACVEPAPNNLRLLRRNLELNGVCAIVIAAAVDAHDRPLLLEINDLDYDHKVITSDSTARPTVAVDGVSVPTILRRLAWERINLLKVDIEGHEATLFACGCDWLHRVDALCIEWHIDSGPERLAALAQRFGFSKPQQLRGIWFMQRRAEAAIVENSAGATS